MRRRCFGGQDRRLGFLKRIPLSLPGFPGSSDSKESAFHPGSERSSGTGNGYPLQYSCLGNPLDRGAWQATVHRVEKSQN